MCTSKVVEAKVHSSIPCTRHCYCCCTRIYRKTVNVDYVYVESGRGKGTQQYTLYQALLPLLYTYIYRREKPRWPRGAFETQLDTDTDRGIIPMWVRHEGLPPLLEHLVPVLMSCLPTQE